MDERLKLYTAVRNSAGERVRIALNLKGLDWDFVSVPDMDKAGYAKVNPQGLMPALAVDGRIIGQSGAILDYVERRWPQPPLLPADPFLRAQALAFGQYVAAEMHAVTVSRVGLYLETDMGQDAAGVSRWLQHWNRIGFGVLEDILARREKDWRFCFGDEPGWADLHLIPQLRNGRRFELDLAPYRRLLEVEGSCEVLPAFIAAAPDNMPGFQ